MILLLTIIPIDQQSGQQDSSTFIVIAMAFLLVLLFVGFLAIVASARRRYNAQFVQDVVQEHQETAIRLATTPTIEEQETEPLVPVPPPPQTQRIGLGEVLARWLVWVAIERRRHPKHGRAMQRTRHFTDLRTTIITPQQDDEENDEEEEGKPGLVGVKQLPSPLSQQQQQPPSYVNPLAGKSYNLPGLLEQGERVFLIALKGFIWNIHELYILNGRKVTRDGFVMDPKRDLASIQALKLTKVEWDYLIGPIKTTPEGKEPGILRQSGTITIDENNGLAIWPFVSAEAAYLHCQEWLTAYIEDEKEQKEGSY